MKGKDRNFNPDNDIPDLAGKVIFVTGGECSPLASPQKNKNKNKNIPSLSIQKPIPLISYTAGTAGLGAESVMALAKHNPKEIYFSGRNAQKANEIIREITAIVPGANLTFIQNDLSSLGSIQASMQKFTSERLDILICNAGIMAAPAGLTPDGYEIQFGTNHLGHALLIKLLLPILLQTAAAPADVRIITLSSLGFRGHPKGGIVFRALRTPQDSPLGPWIRYGQSKTANILFAAELARRHPTILSVSVHPGVVHTDLVGNLGLANRMLVHVTNIGQIVTPAEGAHNQLWAATSPRSQIVSGAFYEPVGLLSTKLDATSRSEKLAAELWDWTEQALKDYS